ncbi:MAG: DUF2357 domain-containing protein [Bacilli bacterium]|jgi:hypothetical protein|nr:DUF2357 domain-containing protein [Bacilli bacterium]
MDELSISSLYDRADEQRISNFTKKTKSDMVVDLHYDKLEANFEWLDVAEDTMRYLDNILRNPNRFIINEDEIVKIEKAKRVTVDSIKHLARNTNLIQDIDPVTEEVKPSKILNINKEETFDTYENRFIYTLIINLDTFVQVKKKDLIEGSYLKDDKSIQYKAATVVGREHVTMDLTIKTGLHNKSEDGNKNGETLAERIDKLQQQILDLKNTELFKSLSRAHAALVRPPIKKTNVILKNTNFQYAVILWNYLQEHAGDDSKRERKDKNYNDEGELRNFFDETFMLDYLALCTLNKEKYSTKNAKEKVIKQVIQKIIDLNASLTEEELKNMVGEQFTLVKYKNNATMDGINKVFKKHIEKYMNKISNLKLN